MGANMPDNDLHNSGGNVQNRIIERVENLPGTPGDYLKELKRKAWITKGARFAASRRFERLHSTGLVATSIIAIFNIIISIALIVFSDSLTGNIIKIASVSSIVISVYLIFLDIFVASKSFDKRSFIMSTSARRINELVDEINFKAGKGESDADSILNRYHQILSDFEGEHADIDFKVATTEYHGDIWITRLHKRLAYQLHHIWMFSILILFPALILLGTGFAFYKLSVH
jgi:conflict system pore-forming effector with SLATT domain